MLISKKTNVNEQKLVYVAFETDIMKENHVKFCVLFIEATYMVLLLVI